MMKKRFFSLLGAASIGLSLSASMQGMPITLQGDKVSLSSVLSQIENQTDLFFAYDENAINLNHPVSVNIKEQSLGAALSSLFENTTIGYEIEGKNIVLFSKPASGITANAPVKKASGTVIDNSGVPVIGASIQIKGSTTGTITDIDGKFTLDVSPNDILVVSYIGYATQNIKVGNKTSFNIVLKEDNKTLDEVVVVGYTTQKKADLSGAVASVKMDEVGDMAVTGINHALQGKMSGVTVYQTSGAPGASASIRVRGLGTIGNNDPLYVIDGMPADNMNDVNPSDIERIDVLKDAASAAIYGSRAANGVVIIQTKKGKKSEKINVTFNTHHGFNTATKKINLLDAAGRNLIHTEAYQNDGLEVPEYYTSPIGSVTRTDWQDEIYSTGYTGNYDLGLSGGSERARYNVALGYLDQNGILKNSGFDRVNFRVNTEMDITKNFKFGENLMITHSVQSIVPTYGAGGAISGALVFDPSVPVYTEDGGYSGSGELGTDMRNPVSVLDRADKKITRDRIFGNACHMD